MEHLPYNDELRKFINDNEDLGKVVVKGDTLLQFSNGLATRNDFESLYTVCKYAGKRMLAKVFRHDGPNVYTEEVAVEVQLLTPAKDVRGNVIPEISEYMVSINKQLFRRCNGNALLGRII